MEVRVLEYFLALAREGSVSSAAEALHVSQPTLSRQLIDLERELGTTLFERGRRGITLTEDGMLLRRRAAEIVDLVRTTESEVMLNRGVVAGEIRIGCAETRAMELVANVMRELRAEHPQVSFRVQSVVAEDAVERVERGLLDFALLVRPGVGLDLDLLRLPSSESAVVVMPRGDPLATRERLTADDLAGRALIVPESHAETGILGGTGPVAPDGRLEVVATYTLAYNAGRMVRAGLGVAVVLDGLVDTSPASGLVSRPLEVTLDMPSYLAWKPLALRSRACEAFLDRARAAFA